MKKIGIRIREIRNILKKSQQELADELNITKQAISNVENGKCSPSISLLGKLNIDYHVNLNYLFSGIGNVFIASDESEDNLKKALLEEVEKFLNARGIK